MKTFSAAIARFASAFILLGAAAVHAQGGRAFKDPERQAGAVPRIFVTSSDGTQIAVREQGPRDARTILFVHGYAGSGAVFYKQLSSPLLSRFHIVTMDLRGHGFSGKPTELAAYTDNGLYADDIHAVIQTLHLRRPVLAAWSFGGLFAFDYVQKYGDTALSGIDLIDSIACPDTACVQNFDVLSAKVQAYTDLPSEDAAANFRGAGEFVTTESAGAANREETLILQGIIGQAPYFAIRGLIADLGNPELPVAGTMASVKVPVLIQYGSNDPLIDLTSIPAIEGLIETSTTRAYPGGGHIPFILNADKFDLDLAEWLTSTVR